MAATVPLLNDRQHILPPGALADLVYNHATSAWTYGAPVVLADALDADSVLMGIAAVSGVDPFTYNSGVQIAVCIGADDDLEIVSEYRTRVAQLVNSAGGSGINLLPNILGVDALPLGSRVTCRLMKGSTVADGWRIRAHILKQPIAGRLAMTTDRQYCLPNGGDDFSIEVTEGGAWSDWNTVRAAAGGAMYITHINLGQIVYGQHIQYEFALGNAGAEDDNIIHRDFHYGGRMTDLIGGGHPQYTPLYVPAATRLSWRARDLNAGALTRTVYMSLTYVTEYLDWFEQP